MKKATVTDRLQSGTMDQRTDDILVELHQQLGWFSESRKNNATGEQIFVMEFPTRLAMYHLCDNKKLTLEQYRLLRQLDAQRKLAISNVEIAEMFGVEPYVVTRAIKCGIKRYDTLLKTRGR